MSQFLAAARREGQPFWRVFWIGGTLTSDPASEPTNATTEEGVGTRIAAALDLNNIPWNVAVSGLLGMWLMSAPALLNSSGPAASNNHVVGALIITWSVISFSEVVRPARLLNVPLGLWLVAAPMFLVGDVPLSRTSDIITGAAVVFLSLRRGRIVERFGSWNRWLI
jgi:hypothetical protein